MFDEKDVFPLYINSVPYLDSNIPFKKKKKKSLLYWFRNFTYSQDNKRYDKHGSANQLIKLFF